MIFPVLCYDNLIFRHILSRQLLNLILIITTWRRDFLPSVTMVRIFVLAAFSEFMMNFYYEKS